MAQAGILNRTSLASIFFDDGSGNHIRIYYQDEDGNIHETCYDTATGWTSRGDDIIGAGCINTGIAATTWDVGDSAGRQIRVYYFDANHYLVERSWGPSTGWTDGDVRKCNLLGTPVSAVAAISTTSPSLGVQVFLQGINGLLWQAFFSPQSTSPFHWTHRSLNVPAVPLGSSIAATFLESGTQRRVFTTNSQNQIIALASSDGNDWAVGNTIAPGSNHQIGAGLACTSWTESGKNRIEVLSVTVDNQLVCTSFDSGWATQPFVIAKTISFSPVACFVLGDTTTVKAYLQPRGKRVIEYGSGPDGTNFVTNQPDVPVKQ